MGLPLSTRDTSNAKPNSEFKLLENGLSTERTQQVYESGYSSNPNSEFYQQSLTTSLLGDSNKN